MSSNESSVRFFLDRECTLPVRMVQGNDNQMFPLIEFPDIVDVGTTRQVIVFMKNITRYTIDRIKLSISDPDVSIVLEKSILVPNEVGKVTITWSPSVNRGKTPLNNILRIEARVIIG